MPELTRANVLTAAVVVFVVAFAGARLLQGPGTGGAPGGDVAAVAAAPRDAAPVAPAAPDAGPVAEAPAVDDPAAAPALVHVAGAVRRPGVYRLAPGARVDDAIRRAGGPRRGADLDLVNLAAKVTDGQQILVPRRGRGGASATAAAPGTPSPGAGAAAGAAPAAPLDLNTATGEQLQTLDGVGPATAAKILAYRTEHGGFRSVDELAEVSGIGPKKLAALRAQVHV